MSVLNQQYPESQLCKKCVSFHVIWGLMKASKYILGILCFLIPTPLEILGGGRVTGCCQRKEQWIFYTRHKILFLEPIEGHSLIIIISNLRLYCHLQEK